VELIEYWRDIKEDGVQVLKNIVEERCLAACISLFNKNI